MATKRSVATVVILCALSVALADCSRPPGGPGDIPGVEAPPPEGRSESPDVPVEPPPPPPPPPPPLPGTLIRGLVADTVFRVVAGARVEVLDGPGAGAVTTTGADGSFSLTATVDNATRFRASKAGYADGTTTRALHPDAPPGFIWFVLPSLTPPVSVAGDYTLTFIADSACGEIPSGLRTRTYSATMVPGDPDPRYPPGTSFGARINGVPAVPGHEGIPVGVFGNIVAFLLSEHGVPYFAEQVTPDRYLGYEGLIRTTVPTGALGSFSTSFHGWVQYGGPSVWSSPAVRCESQNHQLVVTRR